MKPFTRERKVKTEDLSQKQSLLNMVSLSKFSNWWTLRNWCRLILPTRMWKSSDQSLPAKHLLGPLKWKINKAPDKLEACLSRLGRQFLRRIWWGEKRPNSKSLKATRSLTRNLNLFSRTRFQC